MRSQERTNRISVLLARFKSEITNAASLNFTDINREAQNILAPIFQILFDLPNLCNLDLHERQNCPVVDLADKSNRTAFQVTSETRASKVNESLDAFFKSQLDDQYDVLYFFLLRDRPDYKADFGARVPSTFVFNAKDHIIGFNQLLRRIERLNEESQEAILAILEGEFGERGLIQQCMDHADISRTEKLFVKPAEYSQAKVILQEHGVVIIAGPPHIGKSESAVALAIETSRSSGYGRPLVFGELLEIGAVTRIKHRTIVLDDLFGASSADNQIAADQFHRIMRAAKINGSYFIITTRFGVFEDACKVGRIGEINALDELVVKLSPESSYNDATLHEILIKQIQIESSSDARGKALTPLQVELLENSAWNIIYQLRFPHNIERLVVEHAKRIPDNASLIQAIEKAKDIERAVIKWFQLQSDSAKTLLTLLALFPHTTDAFIEECFAAVCAKQNIVPVRLKQITDNSSGYLRKLPHLTLAHPSYTVAIVSILRDEELDQAWEALRVSSCLASKDHLLRLIECKQAVHVLGQDWFGARKPQPVATTVDDYFSAYVETYNRILCRDLPGIRNSFPPYSAIDARIHVHLHNDGTPRNYILFEKTAEKSLVTTSTSTVKVGHYTLAEIEAIEETEQRHFITHSTPDISRTLPEVNAIDDIWQSISNGRLHSGAWHNITFEEGWQLRQSKLVLALKSVGFPLDTLSASAPLDTDRLCSWACPILNSALSGDGLPYMPQMRLEVSPQIQKINDLTLHEAVADLDWLQVNGHPLIGDILPVGDIPWSEIKWTPGGISFSDTYSDDRLLEAARLAVTYYFGAYIDTIRLSFPTLYHNFHLYKQFPVDMYVVIERKEGALLERTNVSYCLTHSSNVAASGLSDLHLHMLSPNVDGTRRQIAKEVQQAIWHHSISNTIISGGFRVGYLFDVKEWREWVLSDIMSDLRGIVEGRPLLKAY